MPQVPERNGHCHGEPAPGGRLKGLCEPRHEAREVFKVFRLSGAVVGSWVLPVDVDAAKVVRVRERNDRFEKDGLRLVRGRELAE